MKSPASTVVMFLALSAIEPPAWSAPIPFTNFANYRRMSPDGAIYGGNPLEAANPLNESSAPWTWYKETVHEPAPFWPVYDGTVTYFDEVIPGGPPEFLPDGRVLFVFETVTTVEARDEPRGDVIGTMTIKATEPHPFIIDTPDRLIVDEPTGMAFSRAWTGDNADPVPKPLSYIVESETGVFADDPYRFVGEQSLSYNAVIAVPLVEGLTPAESLQSTVVDVRKRIVGAVGEWVWSGQYEIVPEPLQAGDADQDLDFDQFDLIQVQQAAKYLTGDPATWGEGDWNEAPGGEVGSPPAGDGLFNQLDIVAAQQAGVYRSGSYATLTPGGQLGDGQTSVVYNTGTGELAVDAPAGVELTSINIDSAGGIFTGEAAQNLGGSFDNDADNNIFKATFGSSFGSLNFGNVGQAGLTEEFVLNDLTVVGSLAGGGDLGNVDLVYVPEPTSVVLLAVGIAIGALHFRRSGQ